MRGYPERTLATRAKWLLDTRKDAEVSATEWVGEMEAILRELANAPEPEPVAHAVILLNGMTRIWFSDRDSGELWRAREGVEQELTPLYTSPPAQSVPDEQLQAAFDRGFKAGNEQDIAQQIEIHKLHDLLAAPQPEQPTDLVPDADLVRDAERYRYLVEKSHYADGPLYLVDKAPDKWVFGERIGAILDAAIERDKKGGA